MAGFDFQEGEGVWLKDEKLWGWIREVGIKGLAIEAQYTGDEYIVLKDQVVSIHNFTECKTYEKEE